MADPVIVPLCAFNSDEFSAGAYLQITIDGAIDPVTGEPVDLVKSFSTATIKKMPTSTNGGVGALVGYTTDDITNRRTYFAVLTGIKSRAADLTVSQVRAGVLCRSPIAVSGSDFAAIKSALRPLLGTSHVNQSRRDLLSDVEGTIGPFEALDGRALNPELVFPSGPRTTREDAQADYDAAMAVPYLDRTPEQHAAVRTAARWLQLWADFDRWTALGAATTDARRTELKTQLTSLAAQLATVGLPITDEILAEPPDKAPFIFSALQRAWLAKGYPLS